MEKENLEGNTQLLLDELPWYIKDFHHSKLLSNNSLRTLYEYYNEFKRFFSWLIESDVAQGITHIKEIPLELLEHLSKKNAEAYFVYIKQRQPLNIKDPAKLRVGKKLSYSTINRTYRALSSLFNYLTEKSEGPNGEPYFYRNVMKKVDLDTKKKETLQSRAQGMKDLLLLGDKPAAFLDFIADDTGPNGYAAKANLSPRAKSSYLKNKERDLAIIALLLASGIRLSEAVYLDIEDVNIDTMVLSVTRKGGKIDRPHIAPFAVPYLIAYLSIRSKRYRIDEKSGLKALFVTTQSGSAKRLGAAAIERTVAKYSAAFETRTTPHKLRHSFATRLYQATQNDVMLATQLGHSSTALIGVYAHTQDDETKDALKNL